MGVFRQGQNGVPVVGTGFGFHRRLHLHEPINEIDLHKSENELSLDLHINKSPKSISSLLYFLDILILGHGSSPQY